MVEAPAFKKCVTLAKDVGVRFFLIEGYSSSIVEKINGKKFPGPDLEIVVKDTKCIGQEVHVKGYNYIPRSCNRAG